MYQYKHSKQIKCYLIHVLLLTYVRFIIRACRLSVEETIVFVFLFIIIDMIYVIDFF